ncbi:MAG: hypothetical protein ABIG44_05205 [Planctomycetota bacterium]
MLALCVMLMLQQAVPQETPTVPTTQPAPPAPTYDNGPLRVEVTAMFDARYWFLEDQPGMRESDLRMQLRVCGERLTEVARVGTVVFDEATDSTGQILVNPAEYPPDARETTQPMNLTPDRLRASGLLLTAGMGSPARAAESVNLKGSLRLIMAEGHEEITIDNPLQYVGKQIENKRLAELGVEIRVVPLEELAGEQPPSAANTYAIQYLKGQDHVRALAFYNGWMSVIRHRERPMQTKDDKSVVGCGLIGAELDENSQLVLEVFPKVDDVRLPVVFDQLKLP